MIGVMCVCILVGVGAVVESVGLLPWWDRMDPELAGASSTKLIDFSSPT